MTAQANIADILRVLVMICLINWSCIYIRVVPTVKVGMQGLYNFIDSPFMLLYFIFKTFVYLKKSY